jgi:hypothetical protein
VRFVSSDYEPEPSPSEDDTPRPPPSAISIFPSETHDNLQIFTDPTPASTHDWTAELSPHHSTIQNSTPTHSNLQLYGLPSQFSVATHHSVNAGSSPSQSVDRVRSNQHQSPVSLHTPSTITSPSHGIRTSWPFQSLHEASLLHHYIVNLSLQVILPVSCLLLLQRPLTRPSSILATSNVTLETRYRNVQYSIL